ncbi:MAG: hypothetical protein HOP17_02140 [Acidobacteria bacterium]|nr:hypothetical protein [Acidobacteriota bacterium]
MPNLALPPESTDELRLADWMELLAILSPDGNSSRGDLESALTTASVFDSQGPDALEEKVLNVFSELESRGFAAEDAYPFSIDGSVLSVKSRIERFVPYIFCLCLSYYRWSTKRNWEIALNPWLLFEELSSAAAAKFLGGDVYRFGTSRSSTESAFKTAVNELCLKLGEGGKFKKRPTLNRQDDKVDLVGWRDFPDKQTSKLLLFGQCAGGSIWTDKVSELQPDAFCNHWMDDPPLSPIIRSFYIPHRVQSTHWDFYARKSGILFDRCRIAYWTWDGDEAITLDSRFKEWYEFIMRVPTAQKKPRKSAKKKTIKKMVKKKLSTKAA